MSWGGGGPQWVFRSGGWADSARCGVAGGAYRRRVRSRLSNHGCCGGLVLRRLAHEGDIPDAAPLIERFAVFREPLSGGREFGSYCRWTGPVIGPPRLLCLV